jgi:hypothetical protein
MKKLANSKIARITFLLCIPLVWLFFVGMLALSRYDFVLARAEKASTHIQNIQNIAKEIDIKKDLGNTEQIRAKLNQVKQEFKGIENEFNTITAEVKRLRLPLTVAKITPLAPNIDTARFLTEAGDEFIQAGWEAFGIADIGIEVLGKFGKAGKGDVNTASGSLSGFGIDLDQATLQELKKKFARTNQLITAGIKQFNQIPLDRLNKGSELERAVSQLHYQLPNLTKALNEGERALATVEALLGYGQAPATYLVLIQDASETRPTGGFIGNYAVINVQYGKLGNFYFDNVYKLDDNYLKKPGNFLKAPSEYMSWWFLPFRWGLRDVNLTPDFPETATYARELGIKLGVAEKIDVVIAVNPKLVQDILRLTGDLRVVDTEFNDLITPDNLVTKLHYYQLQDSSHEGAEFYSRKRFTKLFAETLIDKIKALPKNEFAKVLDIALNSLGTKDILVYTNDDFAQKWLEAQGWAGRVETGSSTAFGTTRDYFMMVDTSMSGNKVNSYIQQAAQDTVSFNPDGTTKHNLKLIYHYTGTPTFYEAGSNGGGFFSYNRLYLPLHAEMLNRQEFWRLDSPVIQYEKTIWGQEFGITQNQKYQPLVEWLSPPSASGLGRDRNGRLTYNILVQRQAATELKYELRLKPPEGYRVGAVAANEKIIPHSNPDGEGIVSVFNAVLLKDTEITVYFELKK